MTRLPLLALLALPGCFDPQLSDHPACGPDDICPAGRTCVEGVCEVVGCPDRADGDACLTRQIPNGVCRGGECVPVGCGDGTVVEPEVCDDGNLIDGDGCSARCDSFETCGGGVLEAGEQCDDGRAGLQRDGCSTTCFAERDFWADELATPFRYRQQTVMAYDAARKKIVLAGGCYEINNNQASFSDTWEWSGDSWIQLAPRTASSAHCSVYSWGGASYDPMQKRVFVYGGSEASTWSWDGLDWHEHVTAHIPSGSYGNPIAYDVGRGRLVAVGTIQLEVGFATTTSEFDGTDWSDVATNTPPCWHYPHLGYDENLGAVVLACRERTTTANHLWRYDGTTWTLASDLPAGVTALAFDRGRGRLVAVFSGGLYEWMGGNTWTLRAAIGPILDNALVYDASREQLIALVQGASPTAPLKTAILGKTDAAFTLRPINSDPPGFLLPGVTYDTARGRIVSFGGVHASAPNDETWEFTGIGWTRREPPARPPGRFGAGAAYDPLRGLTVVFGGLTGADAATVRDDTWEWDGTTWTPRVFTTRPTPRGAFGMVYEASRARMLVFGGTDAAGTALGDTWTYNGALWQRLTPATSPPSLLGMGMAYDATRDEVILFGGASTIEATAISNQTWSFDGTTWIERTPSTTVPPRVYPVMVYDAARGRVVMAGGRGIDGSPLSDAWEWSGTDWSPRAPIDVSAARYGAGAAYDALGAELRMFGGRSDDVTYRADQWSLSFSPGDLKFETCRGDASTDGDGDGLAGCADPDCWGWCTPECPPHVSCDLTRPRCGDGVCNLALEAVICPIDCDGTGP